MVDIKITKGLDIPIKGKPSGDIRLNAPSGTSLPILKPTYISLNLTSFENIQFRLLAKVGDSVQIGEPLAEDKTCPGRMFVAPASGVISEIRRGLKRRLLDIVIKVENDEKYFDNGSLDVSLANANQIIEKLKRGGIFSRIFSRPFHILADPEKKPRSIFVKALESAPFTPPAEMQVKGHEKEFQIGLDALSKLTNGKVHLVHKADSDCRAFLEAKNVHIHTVSGPHPIANPSLHIQHIDPIQSTECVIWTLNAHDVVSIGHLLLTGHYLIDRIISIAGPGVLEEHQGFYKIREGYPISSLIAGRIEKEHPLRLISGDPLMGTKVKAEDFLLSNHFVFTVIPESTSREFLHFFRAGTDKYSFSRAYLSGFFDNKKHKFDFTTSQHGEHRAFIDATLYDKVQPLNISTMLLVKAVMAEDFDLAEELGLLEVDSEDFALPTFVCPSKMEMTEIIKKGLNQHAAEVLE